MKTQGSNDKPDDKLTLPTLTALRPLVMSVASATNRIPPPPDDPATLPSPSVLNWTLGFLLVGLAWGLTTPFIRRAAVNFYPPAHVWVEKIDEGKWSGWGRKRVLGGMMGVVDLLRCPAYAVPLVINLTGSVWFFLLIGKAGEWIRILGFQNGSC